MGGLAALSQLAKNSNRIKDLIIDVLSDEFPLTAKKIHNAIIRKHAVSVAYQNVHKFAKELVEQGVLQETGKEYLINSEWLDQIQEFSTRIKRTYQRMPSFTQNINIGEVYSTNTYGIIQLYKKKLIESLESELGNKPCLDVMPMALTESGVRINAGKQTNILNLLPQQAAMIFGDSGSGKTTALKMLALYQLKQSSRIPILFKLNNYQGESLLSIITKQINQVTEQEIGETVIRSLLHEGSFLFLLDGLNETSSEIRIKNTKYDGYELLLNNLKKALSSEQYSKNSIILTCRSYNDPGQRFKVPSFSLKPLTENMIDVFLSQQNAQSLFKQVKMHKKLLSLCQNPLMLSMLLKISKDGKLPSIKKADIYRYFINEFLYGWENKTIKAKKEIIVNDMIRLLSKVAYEMASLGLNLEYSKVHSIIEKEAKKIGLPKKDLNEIISYILQTNLLVKSGSNCEFMHPSIQEYLAALEIKEKKISIKDKISDKSWHETLVFYSAMTKDNTYIQEIYCRFRETKDHALLFLAVKCLNESRNTPDELFEDVIKSLLDIYHYPDKEFYKYWFELNNVFQSWQSRRVTNRILDFFNSCNDEICPRVVNVLHHSSSALHAEHKGIKRLQEVVVKKSKNAHLLYSAIEIMALTKNTAIVDSLVRFLSDKDPILKAQSAWALKEIGGEALEKVRKKKKVKDPYRMLMTVQKNVFRQLVTILAKKGNEDFMRGHAMLELCRTEYKRAVPYILECLKEDKPIIRYHAMYAIPNLDDEDASFLLNHIQKEVVPEEYSKIVSSITKTTTEVPQNGGREFGI